MLSPNLPVHILIAKESQADLEAIAKPIIQEVHPQTFLECQLCEELITATWLRHRYELVRRNLYMEKHTLIANAAPTPARQIRLNHLHTSIQNFQREVERQKRSLAAYRRLLRRIHDFPNQPQNFSIPQAA